MLESLLHNITESFPEKSKVCLKNVLLLCLGILDKETVNLNRIKNSIGKLNGNLDTNADSHYKRLIRFFDNFSFSSLWIELIAYGMQLMRLKCEYLLLDGTSWKSGNRWFHYLTLCAVYKNVAIPIFWLDLKKHGNSNFKERKKLISKAFRFFDLAGKTLIADREYIGKEWFKLLVDKGLDFVIRSKVKTYKSAIDSSPGKSYDELIQKVLRSKRPYKAVRKRFELNGMTLYFVVAKNPDENRKEPYILLITTVDKPAYGIATIYLIRWKIEHCFFHLKSNGFDLEAMNLKNSSRCKLLMAVVVFAYILSVHEGLKSYNEVALKKYSNGEVWKTKSVFRHGFEKIVVHCISIITFCRYLEQEIRQAINSYQSPKSLNVQ
jgi:hypothetical protein